MYLVRKFLEYYELKREIPILEKFFSAVKNEINFKGGKETFHKILNDMGYQFKKLRSKLHVHIEHEDIVACCAAHLRTIRRNGGEPKKLIVYTDET
jgi:hypothetical protein